MGFYKTLAEVDKKAEHYKALGDTDIFLDSDDPDLPWHDVKRIESGGGYRLNGPTGFRCIAERNGLTLKWSVDFESRDANGKGYSLFDRERLRETAMKLSPGGRYLLSRFLEYEVLPGVEKTTAEWRTYLNRQLDSEDCVRGLIAFSRADMTDRKTATAAALARRLCQMFDSGGESLRTARARHASAIFRLLNAPEHEGEYRKCDADPVGYLQAAENRETVGATETER